MKYHRYPLNESPAHTDDWLMTYADMITLLLCFFAVFLIYSVSKVETHKPALKNEASLSEPSKRQTEEDQIPILTPPEEVATKLNQPVSSTAPLGWGNPHDKKNDYDRNDYHKDELTQPALPSTSSPSPLEQDIHNLKRDGVLDYDLKNNQISRLELGSAAFFDPGSAHVSSSGRSVLKIVADDLKSDLFQRYMITVEGHTDDTPIHTTEFPSNWELSTARAASVVHLFIDEGIDPKRLRASGYADSYPKKPNRDLSGNPLPLNQALNRRVVIRLEETEREN